MDKQITDEIRQMFREGATPSRLMRHLADRLGRTGTLHFLIGDYFREAFGIPFLRNLSAQVDASPDLSLLSLSYFNRGVVAEMVQRIKEWNTVPLEGSWLNGIVVRSIDEHKDQLKTAHFSELSRVWNELNEKEQQYIIRKAATINHDWEVIKCLAMLAERLQQQVVELTELLAKGGKGSGVEGVLPKSSR